MKKREVDRLEFVVFEFDDAYHCDVVSFGEVVHTTERYIDYSSAKFAALEWANSNLKQ